MDAVQAVNNYYAKDDVDGRLRFHGVTDHHVLHAAVSAKEVNRLCN